MRITNQKFYTYSVVSFLMIFIIISSFIVLLWTGELVAKTAAHERDKHFAQKTYYHKVAIDAYRECYQLAFDSRSICLVASLDIAEKSGLQNVKALTKDLLEHTKPNNTTMMATLKLGWTTIIDTLI
jgi:hypothetical protein